MQCLDVLARLNIFAYDNSLHILSYEELYNEIKNINRTFSLQRLYKDYKNWYDELNDAKSKVYNEEYLNALLECTDRFTISITDNTVSINIRPDNTLINQIFPNKDYINPINRWFIIDLDSMEEKEIYRNTLNVYRTYNSKPYSGNITLLIEYNTYIYVCKCDNVIEDINETGWMKEAKYITLIKQLDPTFSLYNVYQYVKNNNHELKKL